MGEPNYCVMSEPVKELSELHLTDIAVYSEAVTVLSATLKAIVQRHPEEALVAKKATQRVLDLMRELL